MGTGYGTSSITMLSFYTYLSWKEKELPRDFDLYVSTKMRLLLLEIQIRRKLGIKGRIS